MLYAEASYFHGAHFHHIAAFQDHQREKDRWKRINAMRARSPRPVRSTFREAVTVLGPRAVIGEAISIVLGLPAIVLCLALLGEVVS